MEMGKLVEVTLATVLFFEETVRLGRFPFELDEELREYMVE